MYVLIVILVGAPFSSAGANANIEHIEFSSLAACKSARAAYIENFTAQQGDDLIFENVKFVIPPCKPA
jgi:hypothetical protein